MHRINKNELVYNDIETARKITVFLQAVRNGFVPNTELCICMDPLYQHAHDMHCFECYPKDQSAGTTTDLPAHGTRPARIRPGTYSHASNQLLARKARDTRFKGGTIPKWMIDIFNEVAASGLPNMLGVRRRLPTALCDNEWEKIRTGHPDEEHLVSYQ